MPPARSIAVALLVLLGPAAVASAQTTMNLPQTVGAWTRPAAPRVIDARAIFKYMDGAGELYVAYRFDRLEVFEYAASSSRDTILVELYWMRSSDDAFGLLSGDWGGDAVALGSRGAGGGTRRGQGFPHALYGAGLLRIWSDTLYARVLASRETPAARQAVMDLGRAIVAGRAITPPPRLAGAVPPAAGAARLRRDQLTFLRSHLVLNAAYYLSSRDILALGPSTEAVLASYRAEPQAVRSRTERLLIVRYPNRGAAGGALAAFLAAYLPEHQGKAPAAIPPAGSVVPIEGGWIGYRLAGHGLAIVFDGPDEHDTRVLLDQAAKNLEALER